MPLFVFLIPFASGSTALVRLGALSLSLTQVFALALLYLLVLRQLALGIPLRSSTYAAAALGLLLIWAGESMVSWFWAPPGRLGYDLRKSLNFFEYLTLVGIFLLLPARERVIRRCARAYLWSAGLILTLTLLKSVGIQAIPGYERYNAIPLGPLQIGVMAIFEKPAGFAAWTLPLLPWLMISTSLGRHSTLSRMGRYLLLLLVAFGISLNGSRSTWLAIAGSLMVTGLLIGHFKSSLPGGKRLSRVFFVTFVVLTLLGLLWTVGSTLVELAFLLRPSTVGSRMRGYQLALEMVLADPLSFLWGPGKDRFLMRTGVVEGSLVVPHNSILEEAVADGFMGLALMLTFFLLLFRTAFAGLRLSVRRGRIDLARFFLFAIGGVTAILFEGIFSNVTPSYGLWIMIVFILGSYPPN
ncbi:MAG: hypothetical protein ACE5JX_22235, partial [Acidobacteriota bacterium]